MSTTLLNRGDSNTPYVGRGGVRVPFAASKFQEMAQNYQDGLTMAEVGEKMGVSVGSVFRALKMFNMTARPRHLSREKASDMGGKGCAIRWRIDVNLELTPEKAYLLGVVGPGDGWINRGKRWSLSLATIDEDFADEFARCFKRVYGVEPTRNFIYIHRGNRKPMYRVENHRRAIVEDLLRYNGGDLRAFKHGGERVPDAVKQATNPEIKVAYIRAFFDSQGGLTGVNISAAKKNGVVLKEIQSLLMELGIESKIYDYSATASRTWRMVIFKNASKKCFLERIGFSIGRKQEKLLNWRNLYESL